MTPTLWLLACAWHGPVPIAAAEGGAPVANVVAMDRSAYNRLLVVAQSSRQLEDGRIEVSVTLANRESTGLGVQFDVQFHREAPDDADAPDRVESSWQSARIAAAGTETLMATSGAPGPASWVVELWVP
jgi:hypothetical protein